MSSKPVKTRKTSARGMIGITLLAGIVGLIVLLMPDGMLLTFMVTIAAITGLSASRKAFDERENQLLWQSYAWAFEGLLLVVYAAFTFIVFAEWLHFGEAITAFAGARWPGLVASVMCILVGIAGLRNFREER